LDTQKHHIAISADEEILWKRFKNGDKTAFAEIYQQCYRSLYSYAYKLNPNSSAVEDAIQELFVDLWRMRQSLAEKVAIKFYLFRSLRRKIHREEKKNLSQQTLIAEGEMENLYPAVPAHESEIIGGEAHHELISKLQTQIENLPPRLKEVILLRYYEDYSNKEIAGIMEISEKTVRNFMHNALSVLRHHRFLINSSIVVIALLSTCPNTL
jgi:RNA polymerase sigma-70 factor (ECF subfamily)